MRMKYWMTAFFLTLAIGFWATSTSRTAVITDDKDSAKVVPVETSMHDFMEGMFQGTFRKLKEEMGKENKTNGTWKAIRGEALILAEGGNLLLFRKPKENVDDWVRHSAASRDAGAELFKAAKKKDAAAAKKAYQTMVQHCNACHKQFDHGKNMLEP